MFVVGQIPVNRKRIRVSVYFCMPDMFGLCEGPV